MGDGRNAENGGAARSGNSDSIGVRLRDAREARRLTTEVVAKQLKLDVSVIEALENDDRQHLPAPIYVQGYLRSYARLLQLPEDELVNGYNRASGELPPLTVHYRPPGKPAFRLPSAGVLRNIVLVMLALVLLWLAFPYVSRMLDEQTGAGDEPAPGYLEIPPVER